MEQKQKQQQVQVVRPEVFCLNWDPCGDSDDILDSEVVVAVANIVSSARRVGIAQMLIYVNYPSDEQKVVEDASIHITNILHSLEVEGEKFELDIMVVKNNRHVFRINITSKLVE